jgi:hypothetical protein
VAVPWLGGVSKESNLGILSAVVVRLYMRRFLFVLVTGLYRLDFAPLYSLYIFVVAAVLHIALFFLLLCWF